MTSRLSIFALPLLAASVALLHCSSDDPASPPANPNLLPDGGVASSSPDGGGIALDPDRPLVPANKVDLLFVVDNSASMGDKQDLLSSAVGSVLKSLTTPGAHVAVNDLHVGVISSSLGTPGGDICDANNPRSNDKGHLLNMALGGDQVVPGAEPGFLSFTGGDIATFQTSVENVIKGVDQTGCGLEAQLEAMYRFVAQPDPPDTIALDPQTKKVVYTGVDSVLLAQRKAFFRPDSAVAIVMLTDEDDSFADPRSVQGAGWGFAARNFPGSKVTRGTSAQGTTAARGTSACDAAPGSADCNSCGICETSGAACAQDPTCKTSGVVGQQGLGFDGYYAADQEDLNVRFFHMKQRFGVDPQYPIDRYVQALSNFSVPNRDTEHDAAGNYVNAATCTNPLFAASLPASGTEELCHLPAGPRSRQLVLFQLIGGVPKTLLTGGPNWNAILGSDVDHYVTTGIDPHMIQSIGARPGLTGADAKRGDNGTDPINGREWDTGNKDLQYACTFPLPTPKDCAPNSTACDCIDSPDPVQYPNSNPPLCATNGTAVQIRAKAYPTVRELRVAKALGDRAITSSICDADPVAGYGPLLDALGTRIASVLAK